MAFEQSVSGAYVGVGAEKADVVDEGIADAVDEAFAVLHHVRACMHMECAHFDFTYMFGVNVPFCN